MVDRNPLAVTIGFGVLVVGAFAAATYAMDVYLFDNVLMLAGLYLLLSPRIHEFTADQLRPDQERPSG